MNIQLSPDEVLDLITRALVRANTSKHNAASVANALLAAELAGQNGHGLRRVEAYCAQSRSGKVDGNATPVAKKTRPGALLIDAHNGFAYPALDLALTELPDMARTQGIASAGILRSHHCGVAGTIVKAYANIGLIALLFANTPAAIAPWGGNKPLFGTNPIAFAAPLPNHQPLVIDIALSKVARGKVMAAAQTGKSIPPDWAFDISGNPTTNPEEALKGTMAPIGDAKGSALALMVELLCAGLTGANYANEASSFFDAEGTPPGVGQNLIVFDPAMFGGKTNNILHRFSDLTNTVETTLGARLPGRRRQELKAELLKSGIKIDKALFSRIKQIGL